ncbi:RICIN domain-containing protein [Amycolatopsis sp. NPDC004378]
MKIRLPRLLARVGVLAALGAVTLGGGVAHADANYVTHGTQAYWITAGYDGLNVAVAGGSTGAGTRIIQWYNDGAAEQKWFFDTVSNAGTFVGYLIRNENSGLCIDTDGNAGDAVVQTNCTANDEGQIFTGGFSSAASYRDKGNGLYLDVQGFSYGAGANVDLWYGNGQPNQNFIQTPVSS